LAQEADAPGRSKKEMLRRKIDANRFITLSPSLADDYELQPDGSYLLQIIEQDGTLAPPPPAPEDVAGLKSALARQKQEGDDARAQLRDIRAALASDDSTSAYKALLEKRLEDLKAREVTGQAAHEQAMRDQSAHYEPLIAEAHAKLEAVWAEGDELVLSRELTTTIRNARGIVAFLEPKMRKFCKAIHDENGENRRVVVFDDDDNLRTNPETGLPVTPEQALEELRAFDPLLAKMAFEPGGNGGAAPH
jgi:hypothetical protein